VRIWGGKGIKNFNKNSPCVKTGIYDKNEGYIMVTNQSEWKLDDCIGDSLDVLLNNKCGEPKNRIGFFFVFVFLFFFSLFKVKKSNKQKMRTIEV